MDATPPVLHRLPPLTALRSFEAAGRLQSVRGAAAELDVTPSAVSRKLRQLESSLGVALFVHAARSIRLTPEGSRYLDAVTEHLHGLVAATDQLTCPRRNETILTVRADALVANWLVARLGWFHRGQPWVALRLTTSSSPADFGRHDVDAEIRPGSAPVPGYDDVLLIAEPLVCVCSPGYLTRHPLTAPADLRGHDLLRSFDATGVWERWLVATGLPDLTARSGPAYGDAALACRAAVSGQGVALLPATLVEPELATGRLVQPFGAVRVPAGPVAEFSLYSPSQRADRRALQAFRRWLGAEVATAARTG
ncbi:LysR substrate-binding domain-containing protein [Pseudonocardia sp. N23]|uniref:LysR substrate-binding domain-containing protein n=1 Tax=Pseudonocardia sp. N23 TaxID=1987376 RepID=UPI000C02B9F8|nr:LysR substrate-binding domain-containing protein [Pseudonocardia sp. N23]GAY07959.1 transcriptional regulator, LysR family [Pseudonocardia sp. N23]